MEPLFFGFLMLIFTVSAEYNPIENLDQILVYPLATSRKIQKRAAPKNLNSSYSLNFIEDKLIEHGQALEQLLKMVQNNEDLTKKLIENLGEKIAEPKMPEKVEVAKYNRRRFDAVVEKGVDNPILSFGKRLPRYGSLFSNVILNHVQDRTDPIPYVERSVTP